LTTKLNSETTQVPVKSTTTTTTTRKIYPLALYRYVDYLKNRRRLYRQRHRRLYGKHPLLFRRRMAFFRPKQIPNNVFYFKDGIHYHYHHHIAYNYPRKFLNNHQKLPYYFYKRNINGHKQYVHHHYHINKKFRRSNLRNVFFFKGGIHKHYHRYEKRMPLPAFRRFIVLRGRFDSKKKSLSNNQQTKSNQAKKQN
jgi:hypothetical protein